MLYDVQVLNKHGVWITDLVTGSKHRAQERGRFLMPRAHAMKVVNQRGEQVHL